MVIKIYSYLKLVIIKTIQPLIPYQKIEKKEKRKNPKYFKILSEKPIATAYKT